MELAVYTAILKTFDAKSLATLSNDTLQVDLKRVHAEVQQLTAAMARMHEMQETVRQLSQGKQIHSTSPSLEKLLANTQDAQQQLVSTISKLATTSMSKPKKEKRKRAENEAEADKSTISIDVASHTKTKKTEKSKSDATTTANAAPAVAGLEAELHALLENCIELQENSGKPPRPEVTLGTLLTRFYLICDLILSSSDAAVTECAAHDMRFVQSLDILLELVMQYKTIQLHHVPSMIKMAAIIADLIQKHPSFKSKLGRHQQSLLKHVKGSCFFTVDKSTGTLSKNLDAICQDSLSLAESVQALSINEQYVQIKLVTKRLQVVLDHCAFTDKSARDSVTNVRMEILAQVFEIITTIITTFRNPSKQSFRFANVFIAVKKSCSAFRSMTKAAETRLATYFATGSEGKSQKAASSGEPKGLSETARSVRQAMNVSLVEIDSWERGVFSLKQFDNIVTILTDVMEYSGGEDWNPRADAKVKDCIVKMIASVGGIKKGEMRVKRQQSLKAWQDLLE